MQKKIELLAPGGDLDSIKAAIVAGADAIYCGLNHFNARNRATNIAFDALNGILNTAHKHNCKIYLTINIVIVESEIRALVNLLNKLANSSIDGVIVQDIGLFYLLSRYFKNLAVHASTQLTTHNSGQIKFLKKLNATQVNLSRELNLAEIKTLTAVGHENNIRSEVFVHGSNCLSFSGICYFSSVQEGKSGNRGRCSQPCRDQYLTTSKGNDFPLNLKDNSAYLDLQELASAGVDSVKIEGRIKKFHYVYTVVKAWREQLDNYYANQPLGSDYSALNKVFNRDLSNAFLQGKLDRELFIDNPRDNSARHLSASTGDTSDAAIEKSKKVLHDLRTDIINEVKSKIEPLGLDRTPLLITISGSAGSPLAISVKIAETTFTLASQVKLIPTATYLEKSPKTAVKSLDQAVFVKKFNSLNETEFCIEQIETENLQSGLYINSKELSSLKSQILFRLKGDKDEFEPIAAPRLIEEQRTPNKATLAVLISSPDDLPPCHASSADIYYQLPSCLADDYSELVDLFLDNRELIPWFPTILIGKDYLAALDLLQKIRPKIVVSNNSGIAYEAAQNGIDWIAGPYLNLTNSFSLLCLKEDFNCQGAFLSNELSKKQLQNITPPVDFKLYYSIYHPLLLLTSRQCLHHQVDGCEKEFIDQDCVQQCQRTASITTTEGTSLLLVKAKGGYHCIYNEQNFLNTEIVTDIPETFSSFFIDLREIKTATTIQADKVRIIADFEKLLAGDSSAEKQLKQTIYPTTNGQYVNGI